MPDVFSFDEVRAAIAATGMFKGMQNTFGEVGGTMGVIGAAAALASQHEAEHQKLLMEQSAMTPYSPSTASGCWGTSVPSFEPIPAEQLEPHAYPSGMDVEKEAYRKEIAYLKQELSERDEIIEAIGKDLEDIDALKSENESLKAEIEALKSALHNNHYIDSKYSGYTSSPVVTYSGPSTTTTYTSGTSGGVLSSSIGSFGSSLGDYPTALTTYYSDWIAWSPPYGLTVGYPPELSGRTVEIQLRNGSCGTSSPENYCWTKRGGEFDIVKYRVVG